MERVSFALALTASFCLCSARPSPKCPSQVKPTQEHKQLKPRSSKPQESRKPEQRPDGDKTLVGRCISVQDGDTLTIMTGQTFQKVHLYAIDAPEKKQDFGIQSKAALWELAFGQTLTVYPVLVEDSDLVQAWVFAGKMGLNAEQVKSGMAWWDRQNARHEPKISSLESIARSAHVGLWEQKEPMAPWLWRIASTNERVELPMRIAPEVPGPSY